MRKFRLSTTALALLCAVSLGALGTADARPGGGSSIGSRGSHTWSAPPRTSITPGWARPMDQSATPRPSPNYGSPGYGFPGRPMPGYGTPAYRPSYPVRHPFLSGFAGGFLGAGLFGLLSGHGVMGGMTGGTSFFGFLLQVLIIGGLIAFVLRMFGNRGQRSPLGMPSSAGASPFGNAGGSTPVTLTNDDYLSFQRLLLDIQAAWSAQNMRALASMATPEMTGYFNAQLSDLASRGARNIVSNVQFQRGDLSEAWREGSLTYATVAMRYSMTDVTTDSMGNVIDGSSSEPVTVTELWTFVRADGRGNWILSAIQQAG
ncbi:Tim44 domain-containing protein [Gluconobacter sphaericus]|uniref:Tim44 domain-containing protein n=1 Tax=Gluconobacter sphaericus TaxID=574987 RepID=UPI001B8BF15C|nr:TIM44-like domain-containing protein [Gluconobacter sphaericus]MBS1084871.1 TIM44-like domain-containing protein [Gluconobacter sphaericus]MBS1099484.1 TIM44-like domain-containing protein [Gluconobacter sphaericus]